MRKIKITKCFWLQLIAVTVFGAFAMSSSSSKESTREFMDGFVDGYNAVRYSHETNQTDSVANINNLDMAYTEVSE